MKHSPEKSIAKAAKLLNSPKKLKVKGDGKKLGAAIEAKGGGAPDAAAQEPSTAAAPALAQPPVGA